MATSVTDSHQLTLKELAPRPVDDMITEKCAGWLIRSKKARKLCLVIVEKEIQYRLWPDKHIDRRLAY